MIVFIESNEQFSSKLKPDIIKITQLFIIDQVFVVYNRPKGCLIANSVINNSGWNQARMSVFICLDLKNKIKLYPHCRYAKITPRYWNQIKGNSSSNDLQTYNKGKVQSFHTTIFNEDILLNNVIFRQ